MVLLHGFIKKTQKTPKQDIDLAIQRMKGVGHDLPVTTSYENERERVVVWEWTASGRRSFDSLVPISPQRSLAWKPGGTTNCRRCRWQ
jgi:hypothetical protein